MKKSIYLRVILIILMGAIILATKVSFAANTTSNFINLTDTINENNTVTSTTNNTVNSTTNNTVNGTTNNTVNNTVLKTNNTSNYNNSLLPKTGIEDSVPAVMLVIIFAISAVYAYKKIQYYKNI